MLLSHLRKERKIMNFPKVQALGPASRVCQPIDRLEDLNFSGLRHLRSNMDLLNL